MVSMRAGRAQTSVLNQSTTSPPADSRVPKNDLRQNLQRELVHERPHRQRSPIGRPTLDSLLCDRSDVGLLPKNWSSRNGSLWVE